MPKYYAVKTGLEGPKIYTSWPECHKNVSGFSGAIYKSFSTLEGAQGFLNIVDRATDAVKHSQPKQNEEAVPPKPKNTIQSPNIANYDKIIVYTDGSCTNLATDKALAGSGIYFPQLGWEFALPVPGLQTHNRGELYAVIKALELIQELKPKVPIEIHIDSTYVMDNINSNNKKNLDLWSQLHDLLAKIEVTWVKEVAHTGVYGNEKADSLAGSITKIN